MMNSSYLLVLLPFISVDGLNDRSFCGDGSSEDGYTFHDQPHQGLPVEIPFSD